jgi:hypothetical protein
MTGQRLEAVIDPLAVPARFERRYRGSRSSFSIVMGVVRMRFPVAWKTAALAIDVTP